MSDQENKKKTGVKSDELGKGKPDFKKPYRKKSAKKFNAEDGNDTNFKFKIGNDSAWYMKYKQVASSVANFQFYYRPGQSVGTITGNTNFVFLPNVICYPYIPNPGYSDKPTDAFNQMARTAWLTLHRKYRGLGSYEQSDLGIGIYAILDAFSSLAKAERLYGIFNYYTSRNMAVPVGILTALGFAANSAGYIGTDLANFRAELNQLILKAKQLCLPKDISLLTKEVRMNSIVLKDSKSYRANIYLFDKAGYWKWNPAKFLTGSGLTFKMFIRNEGTRQVYQQLDYLIEDLQDQFEALLTDSDILRMCSDMLAAIGTENIVTLSLVPENYSVEPEFDDTWNVEIHNCTFIPVHPRATSGANGIELCNSEYDKQVFNVAPNFSNKVELDIYQLDNLIKFKPRLCVGFGTTSTVQNIVIAEKVTAWVVGGDYTTAGSNTKYHTIMEGSVLDTYEEDPSADQKMEMCQFITLGSYYYESFSDVGGTSRHLHAIDFDCFGTEIICAPYVVTVQDGVPVLSDAVKSQIAPLINSGFADLANTMATDIVHLITKFDWHPLIYVNPTFSITSSGATGQLTSVGGILGDTDNPTVISKFNLVRIHDVANLSLLANVLSQETLHE